MCLARDIIHEITVLYDVKQWSRRQCLLANLGFLARVNAAPSWQSSAAEDDAEVNTGNRPVQVA